MSKTFRLLGLATLGLAACFTAQVWGQDFKRADGTVPLPMDWSDQHLIYTVGFTREQGSKMQSDPRFYVQMLKHPALARAAAAIGDPTVSRPQATTRATTATSATTTTSATSAASPAATKKKKPAGTISTDWNLSLGAGGVAAGQYPAKFVFNTNATPSCTGDYVTYPINSSTGNTRSSAVATFSTNPSAGGGQVAFTVTPTSGTPLTLTLTSSTTVNTGLNFEVFTTGSTANATTEGANLAAAINRNLSSNALDEMVAIASSGTVTVYALTAGSEVTLNVPTNSVTGLGAFTITAGTSGSSQANIVAINGLYSNDPTTSLCPQYYPSFIFSYASGVGPVATSPTISESGTQIAYVKNDPNIGAIFHVLTFGSGTEYGSACAADNNGMTNGSPPTCATAPVIPGSTSGSNATDYMLPLGAAAYAYSKVGSQTTGKDTYSAPFTNYSTDFTYVGDDNGYLYLIYATYGATPTFPNATWPLTVNSTYKLSAPVVDVGNTGNVFVGDSEGILHSFNSTTGTAEGTLTVGSTIDPPAGAIVDGPIIDSTNEVGYVVAGCTGTGGHSEIAQFNYTATTLTLREHATLSTGGCAASAPMHDPTPDNNYYAEGISSATTANNGLMYVCYTGTSAQASTYFAYFTFTSKNMSQTTGGTNPDAVSEPAAGLTCSPLTEFAGAQYPQTPTNLTQSGTTVTVTPNTLGFLLGTTVTMSGIVAGTGGCVGTAAADLNGQFTITAAPASGATFSYTSPVSATITTGQCNLSAAQAVAPTADQVFYGTTYPGLYAWTLPLTSTGQAPISYCASDFCSVTSTVGSGTSGIIIDNDAVDIQEGAPVNNDTSNLYFGLLPPTINNSLGLTALTVPSGSSTYTATVSSTTGMPASVTIAGVLCDTGSGTSCPSGSSTLTPNGTQTITLNGDQFTFTGTTNTGGGGTITALTVPYLSSTYTATVSDNTTGTPNTVTISGVLCADASNPATTPCPVGGAGENPNGAQTVSTFTTTSPYQFTFTGAAENTTTGMSLTGLSVPFQGTTYTGTVANGSTLPSSVTIAGVDCIPGTAAPCAGGPATLPNATETIAVTGNSFTFTGAESTGSAITTLTVPAGSTTYTATVGSTAELSTSPPNNAVTLADVTCSGNTGVPCVSGSSNLNPNGAQTVTNILSGTQFQFTGTTNTGGSETLTALTVPHNSTTYTATVGSTSGLAVNNTATISGEECEPVGPTPCVITGANTLNPNAAQTVTGVTSSTFTFTGTENTADGGSITALSIPEGSNTFTATVANTAGLVPGAPVTIASVLCSAGSASPCTTTSGGTLTPNQTTTVASVPTTSTFTYTNSTTNTGGNAVTVSALSVPYDSTTYTGTVATGTTAGMRAGGTVTLAGVTCETFGSVGSGTPCPSSTSSLSPNATQTILAVPTTTTFTFTGTENLGDGGAISTLTVPSGSTTYTATVGSTNGLVSGTSSATIGSATCVGGANPPCSIGGLNPNAAQAITGVPTGTTFTFTGTENSGPISALTVPYNSNIYTAMVSSTNGLTAGTSQVTISGVECEPVGPASCTSGASSLTPNATVTVASVGSGTQFTFTGTTNAGDGGTISNLTVPSGSQTYTATVGSTNGLVVNSTATISGTTCVGGGTPGCSIGGINPIGAVTITGVPSSTTFTFTGTENIGTITALSVPFNSSTYTATVGSSNGLVAGTTPVTIAGVLCASPGDTTPPCSVGGVNLQPRGTFTVLGVPDSTHFTYTSTTNSGTTTTAISALSVPDNSGTYTATVASTSALTTSEVVTIAGAECEVAGTATPPAPNCTSGTSSINPNGSQTITVVDGTHFSFTSTTNTGGNAVTISSLTVPGRFSGDPTVYTATLASGATNGLVVNGSVTIAGVTSGGGTLPESLSLVNTAHVVTGVTATTFTFTGTSNPNNGTYTYGTGGKATFAYTFGGSATYGTSSTYTFDPSSGTATWAYTFGSGGTYSSAYTFDPNSGAATWAYTFASGGTYSSAYTFDPSIGNATWPYTFDVATPATYSSVYTFDSSSGTGTWPYTFYITSSTYGLTTYNFDVTAGTGATVSWLYSFDVSSGGSYSSIYSFDVSGATAGWSTVGSSSAVKLTQQAQ